jgi:hypothetical protein
LNSIYESATPTASHQGHQKGSVSNVSCAECTVVNSPSLTASSKTFENLRKTADQANKSPLARFAFWLPHRNNGVYLANELPLQKLSPNRIHLAAKKTAVILFPT